MMQLISCNLRAFINYLFCGCSFESPLSDVHQVILMRAVNCLIISLLTLWNLLGAHMRQAKCLPVIMDLLVSPPYEPRSEKTDLRGVGPGLTQTGLCNH